MPTSLIPKFAPKLYSVGEAGRNIEANEVDGGFFNYFVGEGKLRITVADVSRKGLKAAMNTVMANGMLDLSAEMKNTTEEIMATTNKSLGTLPFYYQSRFFL